MYVQMHFSVGDDLLLCDFVTLQSIRPGFRRAADLFGRFPRHFVLKARSLLGSAGRQKPLKISLAARPEHRLDRGFRRSIACIGEAWRLGPGFGAL